MKPLRIYDALFLHHILDSHSNFMSNRGHVESILYERVAI